MPKHEDQIASILSNSPTTPTDTTPIADAIAAVIRTVSNARARRQTAAITTAFNDGLFLTRGCDMESLSIVGETLIHILSTPTNPAGNLSIPADHLNVFKKAIISLLTHSFPIQASEKLTLLHVMESDFFGALASAAPEWDNYC